jgi:hypothetical protein
MTEPLQEKARPHWVLRAFVLFGATFAAGMIAFMAWSLVQNWASVDFSVPWLPLTMLACALALLWSGVTLLRVWSNAAFVVFMTMMLMAAPWMLIALAFAFSD